MSYIRRGFGDVRSPTSSSTEVRSPTSTSSEVRSPTSTSTEVRSPTSTSTEVRSPTSTSTDAYTSGNVTVTGGAGAGATSVNIYGHTPVRTADARAEHAEWRRNRLAPVVRATPSGYALLDRSPPTVRARATDHPDVSISPYHRATDNPDRSVSPYHRATDNPDRSGGNAGRRATGDLPPLPSPTNLALLAVGGYLAYRHFRKRGR